MESGSEVLRKVQTAFLIAKPNDPSPTGFCWRLLFPDDHRLMRLTRFPFLGLSIVLAAKNYHPTRRVKYHTTGIFIHVDEDPTGMPVAAMMEELSQLPDDKIYGLTVGGKLEHRKWTFPRLFFFDN